MMETGEKVRVDLDIGTDILFRYQMSKQIPVPPGSILTPGKTYILEITPVSKVTVGGEEREIILDAIDDFQVTSTTIPKMHLLELLDRLSTMRHLNLKYRFKIFIESL